MIEQRALIERVTYTTEAELDAKLVADLFLRADLKRPIDDLPRIGKMLSGADLIISAWDGSTLIGIARCLTDFSFICYLSDLAVDRAYQRQGIGKNLIQQIIDVIGDQTKLVLQATPQAMTYYPHVGFERGDSYWHIPRKR